MASSLELMMVGSPVFLKRFDTPISGIITGITIRDKNFIRYEVSYWTGDTHYLEWFDQIEVNRKEETATTKIGFK